MNAFTRNLVWNPSVIEEGFVNLLFLYEIVKGNYPQYLSNYLKGNNNSVYSTRSASQISLNTFRTRTEKFKNSFFPFCISEWNKLSNLTKQSENIKKFKNTLMKDIKSNERSLFSIHDPQGVKLLSRLRLNFSHLNKHKFRNNLQECVSAMCGCGLEIESTQHFFFRCHFYHVERSELFNSLYNIDVAINELNEDSIINLVTCFLWFK